MGNPACQLQPVKCFYSARETFKENNKEIDIFKKEKLKLDFMLKKGTKKTNSKVWATQSI